MSIYIRHRSVWGHMMPNNNRYKLDSPAPSRIARDYCPRTPVRSTNVGTMRTSRTDRWQYRFNALQQYTNRSGSSLVPATHIEVYEGKNVAVGAWVAYNRQQYRTGTLPEARKQTLETLTGWRWDKQKPGRRYDIRRDADILLRHAGGERVGLLAEQFSLSRQRVHQIIKKKTTPNV